MVLRVGSWSSIVSMCRDVLNAITQNGKPFLELKIPHVRPREFDPFLHFSLFLGDLFMYDFQHFFVDIDSNNGDSLSR